MKNWNVFPLPGMEFINIWDSLILLIGCWRTWFKLVHFYLWCVGKWEATKAGRNVWHSMFRVDERMGRASVASLFQFLLFPLFFLFFFGLCWETSYLNPPHRTRVEHVISRRPYICPQPHACQEHPNELWHCFQFLWDWLFSSIKTDDKGTIFGASMKETLRSPLVFSHPAVRREKCQQSHCSQTALNSLTAVGLPFSLPTWPKVRLIKVKEPCWLPLQTKGPRCAAPFVMRRLCIFKTIFCLQVLNRGDILVAHHGR